jgi:hypothetical protein
MGLPTPGQPVEFAPQGGVCKQNLAALARAVLTSPPAPTVRSTPARQKAPDRITDPGGPTDVGPITKSARVAIGESVAEAAIGAACRALNLPTVRTEAGPLADTDQVVG